MFAQPVWRMLFICVRVLGWGSFLIFFLLFPNGQFVPRWTRWLAAGWVLYILSWILLPMWDPYRTLTTGDLALRLLVGCLIGGMLAQLYRYLRISNLVERQQTKWVMFSCMAAGLGAFLSIILFTFTGELLAELGWYLFAIFLLAGLLIIPVSIGIAILRYRLWEVNPLINRALVYSLLTVTLVLGYVGLVLMLQQLLAPLTRGSELAIVSSTLAIAALFNPLRRGIQNLIDSRFYRRKYDAAKVLAGFGTTARDETDLERLTAELMRVVDETMQPEFVGLWLRDTETGSTPKSTSPESPPPR